LPEEEIAAIIFEYGEERNSRRIAKWIVESREQGNPITTTKELADLVARAAGKRKNWHIHPATRTFQALRIAVNRELEDLGRFVTTAVDLLQPDGRFVVISFHSLEDRIMKQELRRLAGYCQCDFRGRPDLCTCGASHVVEILTKRPVVADDIEIDVNPRSRSAKLRACRKL
jgi:16S rRNA (cytosine1402-N4)-methyltransferase